MSKESFHIFNTNIAAELGTNEAIFINNMKFWIDHNVANGINFYDGRWWTFNSTSALQEVFFYWSVDQIDRIIKKLVKKGVVLVGNYNKKAADRTRWFAFVDQEKYLANPLKTNKPRNRGMETAKSRNGNREIAESYIDENINSDINLDIGRVFDQNASTPENSLENSLDENKNSNFGELKVNNAEKTTNSNNKDDCCIIYITENNELYSDSIEQNLSKSNTISNKKTITKKTPPKTISHKSKKGSKLEEDWELPEEFKQWALDASGWPTEFIEKQAEKFHDHHLAKGTISKSWAASWRYWCRNSAEYKGHSLKTKKQLKVESRESPKLIPIEPSIPEEFQDSWVKVQDGLKNKLGDATYLSWIAGLLPKEIQEDCLIIEAPTRFIRDWVQQKYSEELQHICKSIMNVQDISLFVRNSDREPQYNRPQSYPDDRGVAMLVY